MTDDDVAKCYIRIRRAGQEGIDVADLIFIDGIPHVVIEWNEYADGSLEPKITVRLDPRYLQRESVPPAEYTYQQQIDDPRRLI